MDKTAFEIARRAAAQLAEPGDRRFLQAVDRALAGSADHERPQRFLDPGTGIALASLLVSAASLAWTIYRDLSARNQPPPPDRLIIELRQQLDQPPAVPDADRERVIEHVARETIAASERPEA